jgi:competence protein ComEA
LPTETIEGEIVVDVEGAVVRPGLHRLPFGSRVGDAIAIAGGYSPQVDIDAAAALLNLAESLVDGAKVHVPARGEAVSATTPAREPGAAGPAGASGLIDINTATSEQLDTLPGIGPVTAAKIIAAREEAPFASVDELLSREVVGSSTFEKLRSLVAAGL